MTSNPRSYPETMLSAESGRIMTRGVKRVTLTLNDGKRFHYNQPGWWCSLDDPDDMEGQLVDSDNTVAHLARQTAKVIANRHERVFVPVVIRAIREHLGLTQREAGRIFGTGDKSFEKYESGETVPSEPTKRLLRLAYGHPKLFKKPATDDGKLVHGALKAADTEQFFKPLFAEV